MTTTQTADLIVGIARLNRGRAEALLKKFGATKTSELAEKDHDAFLTEGVALLRLLQDGESEKISLRDAFAMAALQSPLSQYWAFGPPDPGGPPAEQWAERAYLIADAMLARRKS